MCGAGLGFVAWPSGVLDLPVGWPWGLFTLAPGIIFHKHVIVLSALVLSSCSSSASEGPYYISSFFIGGFLSFSPWTFPYSFLEHDDHRIRLLNIDSCVFSLVPFECNPILEGCVCMKALASALSF